MEKIKVVIEHKIYYATIYPKKDSVAFELESDSDKYINNFNREQLINIDKHFKQADDTVEGLLKELKELFEEYDCGIEENKENENIYFIFHLRKRDIRMLLIKIDDNVDISYDHLSDHMKEIIDDNQLVIGIDLGTTYSCAAIMIDKNIIMIRNSLGLTTTPSYVSFLSRNCVYVGELAKLLPSNEKNVIYNAKRLIGKNINDKEIVELSKSLPFKLKQDEKFNFLKILLQFDDITEKEEKEGIKKEEELYPEQICSLILKKIIKDSEFYLSKKIKKNIQIRNAVITVPAYFNQKQREATLNSAKIMGLNVKTIINEPTAASLAYAQFSKENCEKNIVVIDFGGGTLDITLLKFKKNENSILCDVQFAYGNSYFGGEDFDNVLMDICIEKIAKKSESISEINKKIDYKQPRTIRLKRACERAKIKLSSFNETKIHLENYTNYESIDLSINRHEFESYCSKLFKEFKLILDDFLLQSKADKNNISEVILIGGSTLIPKIKEIIEITFDKSIIKCDLNPKEVVAMGASIRAAKSNNLPSVKDIKLFDVTNLSLGIRIEGNKFSKIIERSKPIPFDNKGKYKTTEDNQTNALIEVYEGEDENECDKNNLLLGKFTVYGLPKAKKGDVEVVVKLDVKEDSILEVTATYEQNNKKYDKKLIIERPKEILSIMDELKGRYNSIELYENEKYNEIKFSIIDLEEKIRIEKIKKNINKVNIETLEKNVIEGIGNFLIKNKDLSNLYISFIKFYFNKICQYYQEYNSKNMDGHIKDSIIKIFDNFDNFELRNTYFIFEIIEEYIDLDNIYKSFKDLILKNYWEKINTIIYLTTSVLREKKRNHYDKVLRELSEAKIIANVCKGLINKYMKNGSIIAGINERDVDDIILKIEVREEIIKVRQKNFLKKLLFTEDLAKFKKLYESYSNCPFMDIEDLNEIGKIIGLDESFKKNTKKKYEENYEAMFEKASKFNQWLEQRKYDKENDNRNHIFNTIHYILTEYPYKKLEKEATKMWNDYYNYKSKPTGIEVFLDIMKSEYQELCNLGENDIEIVVYDSILQYINKILSKISKI